jgi:hypothetical protein
LEELWLEILGQVPRKKELMRKLSTLRRMDELRKTVRKAWTVILV